MGADVELRALITCVLSLVSVVTFAHVGYVIKLVWVQDMGLGEC